MAHLTDRNIWRELSTGMGPLLIVTKFNWCNVMYAKKGKRRWKKGKRRWKKGSKLAHYGQHLRAVMEAHLYFVDFLPIMFSSIVIQRYYLL